MKIQLDQKPYLTRDEAAQWLRETYGTGSTGRLNALATTGGGPAYRMFNNRSLYQIADLKARAESRLSKKFRSTSERIQEAAG